MNKRILELEKQATETVECGLNGSHTTLRFNRKKFAELIIRTCIAKCDDLNSMKYIADHFDIKFEFDWMK